MYARTTGFHKLLKTGTPQEVQAAINEGADLKAQDEYGMTPLLYAAWNNDPEVIRALLKADLDVNSKDKADALRWAASTNPNPEMITVLLKAGAEVNARDKNGWTALMLAARDNQNPEVITTLIKAGADGKAKNTDGKSALDYAHGNVKLKGTDALKQLEEASK